MNRFLREEWRDTDVPESVYRRARDRAWEKLQKGEHRHHLMPIVGALAASAVVVCILLLLIPDTPPISEEIASLPLPNDRVLDSLALAPRPEPWTGALEAGDSDQPRKGPTRLREEAAPSRGTATDTARISRTTKEPSARQLVLHFRLPKTGTRMMWILTKEGL